VIHLKSACLGFRTLDAAALLRPHPRCGSGAIGSTQPPAPVTAGAMFDAGRCPRQRKMAFARVRAPQSLSGALSELAARNRLPDRIQEISHVKRFSEELETVFRGKLHRPHVPGDHYDRQPHALGVKGKLRAWLAGYPAIENDSIDLGSVAGQNLPHGDAAICRRCQKTGDLKHFDEYGANVRIVVHHKNVQSHVAGRPLPFSGR
jgi:hypothetical protein